jgi:hypothetical protein
MTWMKTMHQRNLKSIHEVKRSRIRWKYLKMGENQLGEQRHQFLGVDFTQELQDSMEEPWNNQRGSWGRPHGCSWVYERERSEKNREGVRSVLGFKPWKPDSPVFETGHSSFSWTTKNSCWGARNLNMSSPPLWNPAWGLDMSDLGLSHWAIWLGQTCLAWGLDMSGQSLWNPARGPNMFG